MKTTKMKTRELTDLTLDYAVATLEYPKLVWGKSIGLHAHSRSVIIPYDYWEKLKPRFDDTHGIQNYTTDWEGVGRIIEREGIGFFRWDEDKEKPMWTANTQGSTLQADGPSPLVAAMRVYVLSKLGEEIEIPEELV